MNCFEYIHLICLQGYKRKGTSLLIILTVLTDSKHSRVRTMAYLNSIHKMNGATVYLDLKGTKCPVCWTARDHTKKIKS
jgi:hypothetical protein